MNFYFKSKTKSNLLELKNFEKKQQVYKQFAFLYEFTANQMAQLKYLSK